MPRAFRWRRIKPTMRLPATHAWWLTLMADVEDKTVGEIAAEVLREEIAKRIASMTMTERRLLDQSIPLWVRWDRNSEPAPQEQAS